MESLDLSEVQGFFEQLAIKASEMFIKDDNITHEIKKDGSPVTEVDKGINAFVIKELEERYPGIPILSEEYSERGDRLNARHCFVIDPIDATKALQESRGIKSIDEFAKFVLDHEQVPDIPHETIREAGYSSEGFQAFLQCIKKNGGDIEVAKQEFKERITEYTVLLGLTDKSKSVCGICYVPATGVMYSARTGAGAFKITGEERKRIQTSNSDPEKIVLARYNLDSRLKEVMHQNGKGKLFENSSIGGSFGIKIAWVAEGRYDAYFYTHFDSAKAYHARLWDSCAADIVLREAGGTSFDLDGKPIDYQSASSLLNRGYVALGKNIGTYADKRNFLNEFFGI